MKICILLVLLLITVVRAKEDILANEAEEMAPAIQEERLKIQSPFIVPENATSINGAAMKTIAIVVFLGDVYAGGNKSRKTTQEQSGSASAGFGSQENMNQDKNFNIFYADYYMHIKEILKAFQKMCLFHTYL